MSDLDALRQQYLELTNETLPQLAEARQFPVRFNHCFQRIVLDNLFGQCWYQVLDRKAGAAYRQLTAEQLQQAIAIAEAIMEQPTRHIHELNQNSLRWRGKQ